MIVDIAFSSLQCYFMLDIKWSQWARSDVCEMEMSMFGDKQNAHMGIKGR